MEVDLPDGRGKLPVITINPTVPGSNTTVLVAFARVNTYNISGRVFNDLDEDCQVDTSEPLVSGEKVSLFMTNGTFVAETTTDSNGKFTFENVREGTYTFVTYNNFTSVNSTVTTAVAADKEILFCLSDGASTVSGRVYIDRCEPNNASPNGAFNNGEAVPVGTVVTAVNNVTGQTFYTQVAANGQYLIEFMVGGSYTVSALNMKRAVTVAAGANATNQDLVSSAQLTIRGAAFDDVNGDRAFTVGEALLPAIDALTSVRLNNSNGT